MIHENRNGLFDIDLSDHIETTEHFQTAQNSVKYGAQQMFEGIPIFGANIVIEEKEGVRRAVFGKYFDPLQLNDDIPNMSPLITADDALSMAINSLNISAQYLFGRTLSQLFVYHHDNMAYLCWMIRFSYFSNDLYQPLVIIDANHGNILNIMNNRLTSIVACGDGGNEGIGLYSLCLNTTSSDYLLNDYIEIYDNKYNYYFNIEEYAELVTCSALNDTNECLIDDDIVNGGYCSSCDVYSFINIVFDLYNEWLNGTFPIPDDSIPLKVYVHVGRSWDNANWDPLNGAVTFGDGSSNFYPFTVLDITAHEIAHAFIDKTALLIRSGESGALSESYSDLLGEVAEYYYRGNNDWKVGADLMKYDPNGAIRYMNDPPLDGVSIDSMSDYYNTLNVHYASGIYNKVFYLLNTSYLWSMKELFQVFSYALSYYWASDTSLNEAVCGVIEALHDLYSNDNDKLQTMENGLLLAFLSVGLECLSMSSNTTAQGIPCGTHTYCYYQDIFALNNSITEFTTPLVAQHDGNTETNVEIYYHLIGEYECIYPSITFKYEEIDYEYYGNYIDVFNNDGIKIKRCGGGGIIDDDHYYNHNGCGVFVDCIANYNINHRINGVYKISITESQSVEAKCTTNHLLSLNAILSLKCNNDNTAPPSIHPTKPRPTVSPTNIPSINPTLFTETPTTATPTTATPTISPTLYPTVNVSVSPTLSPTLKPTTNATIYDLVDGEIQCGDIMLGNTIRGNDSSLLLFRLKDNHNFGYYVAFEPCNSTGINGNSYDILLKFYNIDLDIIKQKDDGGGCPSSVHPILVLDPLDAGDYMLEIASWDDKSYGQWRMAVLCLDYYKILNEGKIENGGILCGHNRYCYDLKLNITRNNETFEFTQNIQHNGTATNVAIEYEVYLVANGEYDCYLPSITFSFERIDHYFATQFIDVYDNEEILIQRCGADHKDNECDVFDECFVDNYLEWNAIKKNESSYLITIVNSANIEAICNNTINASLTVKCYPINSTFAPTMKPTLNPTMIPSQPTLHPTAIPSVAPTLNPSLNPTFYTSNPTSNPSLNPTLIPTRNPSSNPSLNPTLNPTLNPSNPTLIPTQNPSLIPTTNPSLIPTLNPSLNPTLFPTSNPSLVPTANPILNPTLNPTSNPTLNPSNPTLVPTKNPSLIPTLNPSSNPTLFPTSNPSLAPTANPILNPTSNPTLNPSNPTLITTAIPSSVIMTTDGDERVERKTKNSQFKATQILLIVLVLVFVILIGMICNNCTKKKQQQKTETKMKESIQMTHSAVESRSIH